MLNNISHRLPPYRGVVNFIWAQLYTVVNTFSSVALITIDMQQDTLDGHPFEIPGTSAILPPLKRLLHYFREAGKPIIHMVRIYQPDGSNVDLCRRELVEQGAQLVLA